LQLEEPALEVLPLEHLVQVFAPLFEYVPALHFLHDEDPSEE